MTKEKGSGQMAGVMERARVLSGELAATTDELNRAIVEAEKAIKKLNLGVRASAYMQTDQGPFYDAVTFAKHNGDWRLFHEEGRDDEPDPGKLTPLVSASRQIRLDAVALLPKLVEKLIEAAENEVKEVRDSVGSIAQFIDSLGVES